MNHENNFENGQSLEGVGGKKSLENEQSPSRVGGKKYLENGQSPSVETLQEVDGQ